MIQTDFASWAESNMNANATSKYTYSNYLDSQLEGVRPVEIAYYDEAYSPRNLAIKGSEWRSDSELLTDEKYFLKDPNVWLAYMGSYALFNGKKISNKSIIRRSGIWQTMFDIIN